MTVEYVYGLERISQSRNGVAGYYLADGQGSVRELTNVAGDVTDQYWYTAFGEELGRTGTTVNEFLYVGEQWDPNAGFYYLRARWMDPARGRFVSVDPWCGNAKQPISLHKYLYAHSSPVEFSDPTGLMTLVAYGGTNSALYATENTIRSMQLKTYLPVVAKIAMIGVASVAIYKIGRDSRSS